MINTNQKGVTFVKPSLLPLLPQYTVIADCIAGERQIKSKAREYLPDPSPIKVDDEERSKRYADYITRAVFYNATRRTQQGLVGSVFEKAPLIHAPGLDSVVASASGNGVPVAQQAKDALGAVLAYSRAGLLVDFPQTEGATSVAQVESGHVRPTITLYRAENIRNWLVQDRGAQEVLTLVVLREEYETIGEDGFSVETAYAYRVLRRSVSNEVTVEFWTPKEAVTVGETSHYLNYAKTHETVMLGADGEPLREIPFAFIGMTTNAVEPESPAFYDIAALNLAHYRNSADYEEAAFILGQPTVAVSGLTENWFDNVLGKKIQVGSRGGIPLPTNGSLTIAQAAPNTMLKEAMDKKENQMIAIGARLVEQASVQRTATEATLDASAQVSSLQSSARNVSAAYLWALKLCGELLGLPTDEFKFQLNDDFQISKMSSADRQDVVKSWQANLISWSEARTVMRKVGIATQDDAEAKEEIDKLRKEEADLNLEATLAISEATAVSTAKAEQNADKSKPA
jgi:hypothetical protein